MGREMLREKIGSLFWEFWKMNQLYKKENRKMTRKSIAVQVLGIFITVLFVCSSVNAAEIIVWDEYTEPSKTGAIDHMNDLFEKAYPDIKIERVSMAGEDMRKLIKTALSTGTGPDIAYTEATPGHMGALARAGLILDLTEIWDQYGWTDRLFADSRRVATFDEKVWGIGNELETILVYYNKNIFRDIGYDKPDNYEDLISICEGVKSEGYIPFGFASRDYWTSIHPFMVLMNLFIPRNDVEKIMFETGNWDHSGMRELLEMWCIEFPEKGYFTKDFTALGYDDGNMSFFLGQSAMRFTGTWLLGEIMANVTTFEAGAMLFPQVKKNIPSQVPLSFGAGYVVSKTTAYPEECFKYLDFLMSPEKTDKIWVEEASLVPPFPVNLAKLEVSPLQKEALQIISNFGTGIKVMSYSSAEWWTEVCSLMQGLYIGQTTVDEVVDKMSIMWEEDRAKGLLRGK